jgi:K+-sensing histidine kinase KdpD
VSVQGRLRGTWLRQLSLTRQVAAWVLAVAGPVLLTLAALGLRSSLVLGGFLFSTLLVIMAVAVIGGTWPALAGVVFGVLARVFFFGPPFEIPGVDVRPNLVSLVGFTVAGAAVSILIGKLVRLAAEQAALQRVATLVAHATPADELFAATTEEVGRLLPSISCAWLATTPTIRSPLSPPGAGPVRASPSAAGGP